MTNRILTADVILTLTAEQAACLAEICHFVVGRVDRVGGVVDGSHIGHTTGVLFAQLSKQGVSL